MKTTTGWHYHIFGNRLHHTIEDIPGTGNLSLTLDDPPYYPVLWTVTHCYTYTPAHEHLEDMMWGYGLSHGGIVKREGLIAHHHYTQGAVPLPVHHLHTRQHGRGYKGKDGLVHGHVGMLGYAVRLETLYRRVGKKIGAEPIALDWESLNQRWYSGRARSGAWCNTPDGKEALRIYLLRAQAISNGVIYDDMHGYYQEVIDDARNDRLSSTNEDVVGI